MKFFVVRHGQTVANSRNEVCGARESELTDKGRMQAKELAECLLQHKTENDIRSIYVSPLKRARDTCGYIEKILGLTATVELRLTEFNFGTSEGVQCDDPVFVEQRRNPYARFEGGESMFMAAQRLYNLLDELKARHGPDNENVLLVCHGTVSRVIETYFRNVSIEYFVTHKPGNCEISEYKL